MTDLTVIILTKNEEKNIEKCIRSFGGGVKRFVVVDSFSTDRTKEICEGMDAEIDGRLDFYEHPFENQAAQINWAIDNIPMDTTWVMRIDADEELTPELAEEIKTVLGDTKQGSGSGKLEKKPKYIITESTNGIVLKRRVYFMGRWIKHGGRYPEMLLRIWRNGKARCEQKIMDEHIVLLEGDSVTFRYDLIDNNQKDLEWWTAKHNWYSNREVLDHQQTLDGEISESIAEEGQATKQAERKRKVKNGGYYRLPKFFRAKIYFLYRYYIKLGFLDGPEGKIFHFLQAYWYRFLVDAKMYECEKKGTKMQEQGELKA